MLKKCMRNCLTLIKNIVYERYFLSMLNVEVPPMPPMEPISQNKSSYQNYIGRFASTDKVSPFLITQ